MARNEVPVTCPHCGYWARMPVAALQRDNYHCSRCGMHVPLSSVKVDPADERDQPRRARSKRPYSHSKRR